MIELSYQFKHPGRSKEFTYLHPHLRRLFMLVTHILNDLEHDVLISKMISPDGSGRTMIVMPMPRETTITRKLDQQMQTMCECLNRLYPRRDNGLLIRWLQTAGLLLQVPSTLDFKDFDGSVPETDT